MLTFHAKGKHDSSTRVKMERFSKKLRGWLETFAPRRIEPRWSSRKTLVSETIRSATNFADKNVDAKVEDGAR